MSFWISSTVFIIFWNFVRLCWCSEIVIMTRFCSSKCGYLVHNSICIIFWRAVCEVFRRVICYSKSTISVFKAVFDHTEQPINYAGAVIHLCDLKLRIWGRGVVDLIGILKTNSTSPKWSWQRRYCGCLSCLTTTKYREMGDPAFRMKYIYFYPWLARIAR